ncbi:GLPGLI family protein [Flavobacterium sp. GNP001]
MILNYKMLNLLFLLCNFTLNNSSNLNVNTVNAVYYKIDRYDSGKKEEKSVDPSYEALKEVELALYFTKDVAVFKQINKISLADDLFSKMANIIAGGERYCNLVTKQKLEHMDTMGEEFNLVHPFEEYTWEITSETKKINGYTCYKAISHTSEYSKLRKKSISMDPVVWFTPAMPFSFGPAGLDGLPGLVLEGSINGRLYFYATKIEFDIKADNVDFSKPKKGKFITPAEFEDILLRDMN